jgi:hypothetical protein
MSSSFHSRLKRVERMLAATVPRVQLIEIRNDPERAHAGPDEATVAGVTYVRLEGEDRGVFHARLCAAAAAAGQMVVCISLADFDGPFLDDFRIEGIDQTKTIEIGSATQ